MVTAAAVAAAIGLPWLEAGAQPKRRRIAGNQSRLQISHEAAGRAP